MKKEPLVDELAVELNDVEQEILYLLMKKEPLVKIISLQKMKLKKKVDRLMNC